MNRTGTSIACLMLLAALPDARAQAAPADPALEAYVSLERMLALNGRCHWLAGNTLEYRGLSNTRDERLAWLTASGKVLAASLAVQNLPQVVAGLPSCTGKEGEALGRQIRGIAGQVAVQWILRAYILQSPQFPDRDLRRDANPSADATDPQGRPHWFHGLSLLGGEREKLSAVVLGLQNPAQHGPQEIAWVEAQQKQALADALRWGRFSCKPWKGGIYHDAGTCPAIPMEDRQYRDYAQHWGTLVNDMAMAVSYRD